MSVEEFSQFLQYDIARAEIEAWRGECLDTFAQCEAMIGALLELAYDKGFEVEFSQQSSQRTIEAMRVVELVGGSEEEVGDALAALAIWQEIESRGELLAHGMVTEAIDRHGKWYAIIDMITYRGNKPNKGRWVVGKSGTEDFQKQLTRANTKLKLQLGCVRLRLDD